MACRNLEKAEQARQSIVDSSGGLIGDEQLDLLELDLNSLASTRQSAETFNNRGRPLHLFGLIGMVVALARPGTEAVLLPEFELEIWGHAHRDYTNMSPLRSPRPRTTRWQIATAHGHYEAAPDPNQKHHPSWLIDQAEIEATGADYVALGHWNTPVQVSDGAVAAYYSGSPELAKTVNMVRLTPSGAVEVTREAILWDRTP